MTRAQTPWTEDETRRLLDMHRLGDHPEHIARHVERTIGAVKTKLLKLAREGKPAPAPTPAPARLVRPAPVAVEPPRIRPAGRDGLTRTERQAVEWWAAGMSARELANRLGSSPDAALETVLAAQARAGDIAPRAAA